MMDEKLSLFTVLGLSIVAVQIGCEVSKQLATYSLQYSNGGRFPIPMTVLVVACEAVKLAVTFARSGGKCPATCSGGGGNSGSNAAGDSWKASFKFAVPGLLYGVNNNIYLYALTMVSPPVWNILISVRTVLTALVYKFAFKRPLTRWQFLGVFLIVMSIAIVKMPDLLEAAGYPEEGIAMAVMDVAAAEAKNGTAAAGTSSAASTVNALPLTACVLALVAAFNSVGAAVFTERLFKGAKVERTFLDQQFWLYLYGVAFTCLLHIGSNPGYGLASLSNDLQEMPIHLHVTLAAAVFFASFGGIVVASILKLLDNVVKEYSAYSANVVTAITCSFLFPDKFQITIHMVLSIACLMTGIYFYEAKSVKVQSVASPS